MQRVAEDFLVDRVAWGGAHREVVDGEEGLGGVARLVGGCLIEFFFACHAEPEHDHRLGKADAHVVLEEVFRRHHAIGYDVIGADVDEVGAGDALFIFALQAQDP